MTGRLIIASNRTANPGAPRAGGLAVALGDALAERGGVWFGWSGDIVERETRGVRLFAEGNVDFALADLTQAEYEGYYLGYANRALWPVFHYRVDLAHFDEADFAAYEAVNRRFARLLAQFTRPDDTVWVHDYHFLLMGQELRASGWEGRMGFFLHIPFPAPEVFTALPQHQRLARGLCAFDLVGFQTDRDTANFRAISIEIAGANASRRRPGPRLRPHALAPRPSRSASTPTTSQAHAEGDEGRAAAERLGRITENRALVIGVDRMDYSKGLPQRMEAFGRMLDDHEELRGTRQLPADRPARRARRSTPTRCCARSSTGWPAASTPTTPTSTGCRFATSPAATPAARSAASTGSSRVGLVTPLYDGMNLVAKEFVAAQAPDDPGALVLSEFAGAAEQLQAALLVNPHDIAATADAIYRALSMPLEERQRALAGPRSPPCATTTSPGGASASSPPSTPTAVAA